MRLIDFLRDRGLLLLLHLVCMCVAAGFLNATGYGRANILLILIFWFMVLAVWLAVTYLQRRKYFQEMEQILEKVDQRYLLGELLPDSFRLEDRLYREMIRKSNKSVIERIRRIEDEQTDYREYIESWVHEIKAPITSISLICDNRRRFRPTGEESEDRSIKAEGTVQRSGGQKKTADDFGTISMENQRVENYVDMALYYARLENVYKDYLIRETNLQEVVNEVLGKNRLLLIWHHVQADVDCADSVYTDRKWIAFILNQLVLNSVKYCSGTPVFHFYTKREKNGVNLILEDNGTGIPAEELSRIFEKGFTGSNGRNHERSTGMGLYLCRKLCDKLGIGITAESEYGTGTKMSLQFPISNYISRE
ncbi:MAG: sensor histidine kinase [Clostridium sp.]|nr:sensor histidine kinase [Clostridium sp.]